jgi:CubicO group peptidase (beta-lactamase class C family)
VRSVTKSVTGTLAGAAIRQGLLSGLGTTVGETIPDRIPEGADPRVADITLWQWLTMTSGLQWEAYGDWQRLLAAPDWVAMTLGLPIVGIPGQTYVYNTGGSHVLGVTVAAAAGKPLEEYADEVLFRPLGITPGEWMRSPQDEVSAGSGLEMTARDMLKLAISTCAVAHGRARRLSTRTTRRRPPPGRAPAMRPVVGPGTAISGGSPPQTPAFPRISRSATAGSISLLCRPSTWSWWRGSRAGWSGTSCGRRAT